MNRPSWLLLAFCFLAPPAAYAEIFVGEVASVDAQRNALYLTHRDRFGTAHKDRFLWDSERPETEMLEKLKAGERIQLDAFRSAIGWKIRVAAPAPESLMSVSDPYATSSALPPPPAPAPGPPPAAPEPAIAAAAPRVTRPEAPVEREPAPPVLAPPAPAREVSAPEWDGTPRRVVVETPGYTMTRTTRLVEKTPAAPAAPGARAPLRVVDAPPEYVESPFAGERAGEAVSAAPRRGGGFFGFIGSSFNGAARSLDGAVDSVLRRRHPGARE